MNDVPGYRITDVHGDVFGQVVVARDYLGNIGAQFRSLSGGEVTSLTDLLIDSRNRARSRLWAEACETGANAVVAFRFDCTDFAQVMCEVAAYGTAVTVERIPTGPRPPDPDVVATA